MCQKCGYAVEGDGYTNHCPECLWSRHVDINPGDRKGECGGMMAPVQVEVSKGEYTIIHKCEKCGFTRRNKAERGDNFDQILQIAAEAGGR